MCCLVPPRTPPPADLFRMDRELDPTRLGDHLDRLYRAAWALTGSREDAEDLVQDTYVRVLAKPRFLRREDDLGYLLRVLRNSFLNERRTRSRRPRTSALPRASTSSSSGPAPSRSAPSRPRRSTRRSRPSPTTSGMAVAVDVKGLSYKEAADALGTREGT